MDLLRETVRVSLDSAPEPLKTYHGREIIVLRNGKGSREGIAIPERPARRVEEREEEDALEMPALTTPFYMDARLEEAPVREKIGAPGSEGKSRRRHRGGRRRSGGAKPAEGGQPQGEARRPEQKDGRQRPPRQENRPAQPKPAEGRPAEAAPAAGEGEAKRRRRPHHRGGRRRNKGGGEGGSAPRSE